ncbi:MAG: hypothetical protein HGA37_08260, partial [Lentimicrobium sp.]|nr:hypothetical protein [Lentimicrobium sp.]
MKRSDFLFVCAVSLFFLPFFISGEVFDTYNAFNRTHGMVMSFVKFALLATLGEVIGLRIKTGNYNMPGFGILPRAIVWGFLGLTIKLAFIIFTSGTIDFLKYMGMSDASEIFKGGFSAGKLLIAFCISYFMKCHHYRRVDSIHKNADAK